MRVRIGENLRHLRIIAGLSKRRDGIQFLNLMPMGCPGVPSPDPYAFAPRFSAKLIQMAWQKLTILSPFCIHPS